MLHSRLRGSSDTEAHQRTEDEDPAVNGRKRAHEAVEHGPQHTHLQTLHHQIKISVSTHNDDLIFYTTYST